jgi:diguanylate cyclase (GGDEF)-like protein
VLIAVARTLEANLGTFDFVGRRGGEEFLAVLASADPEWASEVAGRCCLLVQQCQVDWGGKAIRPTISVGVAIRQRGESEGDLLRRADANLDLARQSGGDRFWGP